MSDQTTVDAERDKAAEQAESENIKRDDPPGVRTDA